MKNIVVILASVALLCGCNDDKTDENGGNGVKIALGSNGVEFLSTGDVATGENTVVVTSSDNWRLTGKKTWCMPSAVAGKSGDEVIFLAEENPTDEARSVVFTFFIGDKTERFTVTQRGATIVDVSQDEFSVPATGDADIRIKLESSVALSAEIDEGGQGWISLPAAARSTAVSYLHLKITANDTHGPRSGKVVLRGEGIEPRYITVNQVQNDELKLESALYKQPLTASTLRMTVWSNVAYSVTIPDNAKSWLTLTSQPTEPTGWSSQELVFNLAAAEAYRFASVVFASKDGKFSIPVVMQQGEPVAFAVPDAIFSKYLLDNKYIEPSGDKFLMTPAGLAVTAMDLSGFYAKGNQIESLVGIENFTKLTTLNCSFSLIRDLDLSKNPLITDMTPSKTNAYERLTVGIGVTVVHFGAISAWGDGYMYEYNSKYWTTSFVVSGVNVQMINVSKNKLQTLDVSGCPELYDLRCKQQGPTLTTIYMSESQRDNVTVEKDNNTNIVYK